MFADELDGMQRVATFNHFGELLADAFACHLGDECTLYAGGREKEGLQHEQVDNLQRNAPG